MEVKSNIDKFKVELLVITKKCNNGTEVLTSYKTGEEEFISKGMGYEEGRVVKCYWLSNGKYVAIPTSLISGDDNVDGINYDDFDINYDLSSNMINVDQMRSDIDQKRIQYGNWITNNVIIDVIRAHIEGSVTMVDVDEDLIDDLFSYWANYIQKMRTEKSNVINDSEMFRNRAAKLLGL